MRFAVAATLMAFLGFQTPAWGQETPVQEAPAEPPLDSVISHFFPGYGVVPLGDLAAEIGALTVSEPDYNDPDRSPTSVKADFDGNGIADYALLLRKIDGPEGDEVFVILMGHGNGRYSKAIESFFGGVAQNIYLGYLPPGTVLPAPPDAVDNAPPLILELPAATLNILGQISDAFYWDSLSSRFRNTPAQR